jgi:hypothetical protein
LTTDNTPTEEDIRRGIAVKSDQINFEDCQNAPLTVKITAVTRGASTEQPVSIHLDGHLPYRPCKTMRRVLVAAWGSDARQWIGRSIELYGDPAVKFGGVAVGGIRIRGLSDIAQPFEIPLMVSKGKRVLHRVNVLKVQSANPPESKLDKWRKWLAAKGLSEADAVAAIGGRKLEDATDEDAATLRAWAQGKGTAT